MYLVPAVGQVECMSHAATPPSRAVSLRSRKGKRRPRQRVVSMKGSETLFHVVLLGSRNLSGPSCRSSVTCASGSEKAAAGRSWCTGREVVENNAAGE